MRLQILGLGTAALLSLATVSAAAAQDYTRPYDNPRALEPPVDWNIRPMIGPSFGYQRLPEGRSSYRGYDGPYRDDRGTPDDQ